MPRNIALIAINNSLNSDELNQNDNTFSNNSFADKCLTLLDKFRYYLTDVCLNCDCDQNFSNKLIIKLNILEKEYNKLIKEKTVDDLDTDSNHNDGHNEDNDSNETEDNYNGLSDFEVQNEIKDRNNECGDESDLDNIERSDSESNSPSNELTPNELFVNPEFAINVDKSNNSSCLSVGQQLDHSYNWYSGHHLVYQNKFVYICHIMDTEKETVYQWRNNATALVSKKLESFNEIVGYGCKWSQCCFVGRFLSDIDYHLKLVHKQTLQFKCSLCLNEYETSNDLTQHQHCSHKLRLDVCSSRQPNEISGKRAYTDIKHSDTTLITAVLGNNEKPLLSNKNNIEHNKLIQTNTEKYNETVNCDEWPRLNINDNIEQNQLINTNTEKIYETVDCGDWPQLRNNDHIQRNQLNLTNTEEINKTVNCDNINSSERAVSGIYFNSHIIGTETIEVPITDNCFVSVLYSRKSNQLNNIVGYRCKWANNCQYINRYKESVYEHVNTCHTGNRPFFEQCFAPISERESYQTDHNSDSPTHTIPQHNSHVTNDNTINETFSDVVKRKSTMSSINTNESVNDNKSLGPQHKLVNDHIIGIETEERPITDQTLIKIYNTALMKAHYSLKTKQLIGFKCVWPVCDFFHESISSVQSHLNVSHTGKATFKCKYCGRCFCDNDEKKQHQKSH